MGSILTGSEICHAISVREIEIEPFDGKQLNPVSYDLRLGDGVAVYTPWVVAIDEKDEFVDRLPVEEYGDWLAVRNQVMDVKEEPSVTRTRIGPRGFVLRPMTGYLMHTLERVHTRRYVPVLDGKSSIGRLFIQVHATAGYGDPGFDGQYTLEVTVTHPVRVYAGMRIAQMRFHTVEGAIDLYQGNYTGEAAKGAVPSRAWKQFR